MISTGGDELNTNCYAQDVETQQILNSTGQTLEQALDTFTKATHGALEKLGKTTAVWEGALYAKPGDHCFVDIYDMQKWSWTTTSRCPTIPLSCRSRFQYHI